MNRTIQLLLAAGISVMCAGTVLAQSKMYWTSINSRETPTGWVYEGFVQRANLDGSGLEVVVDMGESYPIGIALDEANGKVYWTDYAAERIERANLDGSEREALISTESGSRIALDVVNGRMYWTDGGTMERANLDGSEREVLISSSTEYLVGVALDIANGKMYWTAGNPGRIVRANVDGSDIEVVIDADLNGPNSIALDVADGKVYWTDVTTSELERSNLDGSEREVLFSGGYLLNDISLDLAGRKVYWTVDFKIRRANLDGSDPELVLTSGLYPIGLALDIEAASTDVERASDEPGNDEGLIASRVFPNPTRANAHLSLDIDVPSCITVAVYDVIGRRRWTRTYDGLSTGSSTVDVQTEGLPSGAYFVRVVVGDRAITKSMVVAR